MAATAVESKTGRQTTHRVDAVKFAGFNHCSSHLNGAGECIVCGCALVANLDKEAWTNPLKA